MKIGYLAFSRVGLFLAMSVLVLLQGCISITTNPRVVSLAHRQPKGAFLVREEGFCLTNASTNADCQVADAKKRALKSAADFCKDKPVIEAGYEIDSDYPLQPTRIREGFGTSSGSHGYASLTFYCGKPGG